MHTRLEQVLVAAWVALATPAYAGFPTTPITRCAPDQVRAGSVCIDRYEASVWRVPVGLKTKYYAKIRKGQATAALLTGLGAVQLGVGSDNYAPCNDNGQNCKGDIYALSLPGVIPSSSITWFQAQAACLSSGKRLPTNADWQVAVAGTPDSGPDNGTTDCNSNNSGPVLTGSRSACVSAWGAADMVGNLDEWVAEWVPRSINCPEWGAFSDDVMCFSGASASVQGPGTLIRGGSYLDGANAGPLAVDGSFRPSDSVSLVGFRCAR